MNRNVLLKITYALLAVLMLSTLSVVIYYESPERLIQGEWVETTWRIEKDNAAKAIDLESPLYQNLKQEILRDVQLLHRGVWRFSDNGKLQSNKGNNSESLEWFIKGRGHILELKRNGKSIESFQIQTINQNKLVLHLNFDLQVKGIMEIVLERKENLGQYVKKI
ncbi:hypothetical protein ACL9RF_02940 [Sphingobacterium sp. Mn56C]|uniref:hypothetical protein n=1 Tax=Sphingobacterium sp. Mn56C TaxID=3395261 RepID=UPI003BD1CC49